MLLVPFAMAALGLLGALLIPSALGAARHDAQRGALVRECVAFVGGVVLWMYAWRVAVHYRLRNRGPDALGEPLGTAATVALAALVLWALRLVYVVRWS